MMKYYEVQISYKMEIEDQKGNIKYKNVKELYLVNASSVTNVEEVSKSKLYCADYMDDFEIVSVKTSKIIAVVDINGETEEN